MKLQNFIDQTLINGFKSIQQDPGNHKYLSFGLIAQGIEFLGSLIDGNEIEKAGLSRERFDSALKEFFDSKYHEYAVKENDFNLYSNLRCGMLHIIIPTKNIALGEVKYDDIRNHLKILQFKDGIKRLLLIAEEFYNDFKNACESVIRMLEDHSLIEKFPVISEASQKKIDIIELKTDIIFTDLQPDE